MGTCFCRILSWNNFVSENKALNSLINPFEKDGRHHSQGLHCLPVDHQRAESAHSFSLRNPLRNLFWQEGKKLLFVVHKLQNWPLKPWAVQSCLPRVGSIVLHCNARHRNLQLATGMFRASTRYRCFCWLSLTGHGQWCYLPKEPATATDNVRQLKYLPNQMATLHFCPFISCNFNNFFISLAYLIVEVVSCSGEKSLRTQISKFGITSWCH